MKLEMLIKNSKALPAEKRRALGKMLKHFSPQLKKRLELILEEEQHIRKNFPKLFAVLKKHLEGELYRIVEQGMKKIKKRTRHGVRHRYLTP